MPECTCHYSVWACSIHTEEDDRMQRDLITITISRTVAKEILSWVDSKEDLSPIQRELFEAMEKGLEPS